MNEQENEQERVIKQVKQWEEDGVRFHIKHIKSNTGFPEIDRKLTYYCGYCEFNHDEILGQDIINAVDVHGGITYSRQAEDSKGYVYGFDCAHLYDEDNPLLKDIDWLTGECEKMAYNIIAVMKGIEQIC